MTFKEWLPAQSGREDIVGDLARFAAEKGETFPVSSNRKDMSYALADHGYIDLMESVDLACDEWEKAKNKEAADAALEHDAAIVAALAEKEAAELAEAETKEAMQVLHDASADPRVAEREKREQEDMAHAVKHQAEMEKDRKATAKTSKASKK